MIDLMVTDGMCEVPDVNLLMEKILGGMVGCCKSSRFV